MAECTTLMKRPCTALARVTGHKRRKVRVYRCEDCGLYRCVCAQPNVVSLGKPIAQARDDRLRARMIEGIREVIEGYAEKMRLRIVPPPEDSE